MIEQAGVTLPLVTIFGPPGSALGYAIRDFLYRRTWPADEFAAARWLCKASVLCGNRRVQ